MPTLEEREVKCSVCGTVSKHLEYITWSCFYYQMDLDYRVNNQIYNFEVCPNCGFVARDLSRKTSLTLENLRSKDYISCCGIHLTLEKARESFREFICYYIDGQMLSAFYCLLNTAWICDGRVDGSTEKVEQVKREAVKCRRLAVKVVDIILNKHRKKVFKRLYGKDTDTDLNEDILELILIIKADLMRRAGMFDELLKGFKRVRFKEEAKNIILDYQKERARLHDDSRISMHTIVKGPIKEGLMFDFPAAR